NGAQAAEPSSYPVQLMTIGRVFAPRHAGCDGDRREVRERAARHDRAWRSALIARH
ncbi:MAG: hypothetical protein ACI9MR_003431, partial [Myxococcota bacterium]